MYQFPQIVNSKYRLVFCNQYALPNWEPGIHRHSDFAHSLSSFNIDVSICASDVSYLSGKKISTSASSLNVDSSNFIFVPSIEFKGNSLGRLMNMLIFAFKQSILLRRMRPIPDIIVGSSPSPFVAFSAFRSARKLGKAFIYEVRDPWPLILRDIGGMHNWHPLVVICAFIEKKLLAESDYVVSLYPGYEFYVKQLGFESVPVAYIPNGVNPSAIKLKSIPFGGKFRFVYAGAHGEANNLELLLKAMNWINCTYSEILLAVEKSHVGVICLKNAPSLKLGPSPNKLFDYMLIGRPILYVADTVPDPVTIAKCGITVQDGNFEHVGRAMLNMSDSSIDQLNRWGSCARNYVEEHHSIENLAVKYVEIFNKVLVNK